MTEYAVLLPGAEDAWDTATPGRREEVYAGHRAFMAALAERGHRVTGGAELTHSRTARVVRRDAGGEVVVTDGPYAESAEQLGGFYLVDTDDLDDLLSVCGMLAGLEGAVEVRAAVDSSEEES